MSSASLGKQSAGRMVSNTYLIMAMRLIGTLTGFAFWAAAARLVTPEQVGLASGAVSASGLLGRFALLGLGQALVRFLPGSQDGSRLVNIAVTVVGGLTAAITAAFVLGIPWWSPALAPLLTDAAGAAAFVALALSASVGNLLTWAFLARRLAIFSLNKSVIQSAVSIALVALLAAQWRSYDYVLAAYALGSVISLLVAILFLLPRSEPGYRFRLALPRAVRSPIARYAVSNHIAELLRTAPHNLLPLLVVNLLGPAAGAHFFIVWSIALGLDGLASSISPSFFAEGANRRDALASLTRQALRLGVAQGLVMTAGAAALGYFVLSFYGRAYAQEGYALLVLLAASLAPSVITTIYYSWLRVKDLERQLVALSALDLALAVTLCTIFMSSLGLIGIGLGWLASRVVVALAIGMTALASSRGAARAAAGDDSRALPDELAAQLNEAAQREGWLRAVREHLRERPHLLRAALDATQAGWLFHCYDLEHHDTALVINDVWGLVPSILARFYGEVSALERGDGLEPFRAARAAAEGYRPFAAEAGLAALEDGSMDLLVALPAAGGRESNAAPGPLDREWLAEAGRVLSGHGTLVAPLTRGLRPPRAELRCAGFISVACYPAWSGFTYPRISFSADGHSLRHLARVLANLSPSRAIRLGLRDAAALPEPLLTWGLRRLWPQSILIASRGPGAQTLEAAVLGDHPETSFARLTLAERPKPQWHTTCLLLDHGRVASAVRVTERPGARPGAAAFGCASSPPALGRPLRPYSQADVTAAARWLADMQSATTRGAWPAIELGTEIDRLAELARSLPECGHAAPLLPAFCDAYLRAVTFPRLPVVAEHGDFTPPNLFVGPHGAIEAVDWEYRRSRGNPLTDSGGFLLSLLRREGRGGGFPAFPAPHGPAGRFAAAYTSLLPVPLRMAPAYYVLRGLAVCLEGPSGDTDDLQPEAYYAALTWARLLAPALAYALAPEKSKARTGAGR